jgi:hypothetical protein
LEGCPESTSTYDEQTIPEREPRITVVGVHAPPQFFVADCSTVIKPVRALGVQVSLL